MEKIQYTTLSETKNSSFNYMGCTYCYPVIRQQKYAIKGFSMTSGQNMLCRYTGNDHTLFADVTRPVELKLSFTPEQCKAKNFHLNMTHFLYREGNPVPLSTAIILTNEEAVTTQTFRLPDGEARTGTYFIFFPKAQRQGRNGSLVDIPEGLVYRFSLIAQNVNGSTIGVRYAECHIFNQKVYPHAVHSGNMICRLSLDELPEEPYTLGMYCYNPTFTLMGKEERKFKAIKAQRRQVTFEMSTNRIWHPGVYKLVLTQNRIPISVIDICLQDNNYMTSTVRPMDPDSLLYWMVKELETTDYMVHSWEKIRDHPGIGESRMQFVRMHREWKQKSDNCIRRGAEVLVVSGYTSAAANEAAMGFSDLLMTGKKLKHYFYCDQPIDFLLQSYDSDDYHGDLQIFYSASRLLQPEWEPFMEMLVRRIKQVDDTTLYVFCDTPEGIGRLFSRYPQIRAQSAPERVIAVRKPNTREMTDKLLECFHRCGAIPKIDLFDTMESFLYEYMADSDIQGELIHWNESEMETYARMVRDNAIADQGLAKDVVHLYPSAGLTSFPCAIIL